MNTAKIFANGRSQAVRLPKEFQFDTEEVYINKIGGAVILFPREKGWDMMAESIELFTEDFMEERDQAAAPKERLGL